MIVNNNCSSWSILLFYVFYLLDTKDITKENNSLDNITTYDKARNG